MAYLVIKRVKGHAYAYRQESYREGGKVRTRSEYIGPVSPAVADQVAATRGKLAKADMTALIQSVQNATSAATDAPETTVTASPAPLSPADASRAAADPREDLAPKKRAQDPKPVKMTVNRRPALVDPATGELLSSLSDSEVITTETAKPTLRPFQQGLQLPAQLEDYGLSALALQRTHARHGQRLKALKINPATMPDVKIEYGHPDRMTRNRDGSYTVYASRRTQNVRHQINKTKLWQHYRQALASAYFDALEGERPELHNAMRAELDESHKATKRLLLDSLALAYSPAARLGLSLQLYLWDKIPRTMRGKADATDFGQVDFASVNDWRAEAVTVLADVQKSGWQGSVDRAARSRQKIKAAITKKRNQIDGMKLAHRLSGKRRKFIRDVLQLETKQRAVEQLERRLAVLKDRLEV